MRAHLSYLGEILKVPLREDRVVVHVETGALPTGHGGAEEATIPILSRVEHDAHRARARIICVLYELAQNAICQRRSELEGK